MNTKQCPYCGEEIAEAARKCKHCGEWLNEVTAKAQEQPIETSAPSMKKTRPIILWIGAALLAFVGGMVAAHFIGKGDGKMTTTKTLSSIWKTMPNNIITSTSIAGVEVIGKSISEVKSKLNPALTCEDIGYEDGYATVIKKGETSLLNLIVDYPETIRYAYIFDTFLETQGGLHVGSTTGDILKKYPNATVSYGENEEGIVEYIKINKIRYYYDGQAGKYSGGEYESKIINKDIKINFIGIYGD